MPACLTDHPVCFHVVFRQKLIAGMPKKSPKTSKPKPQDESFALAQKVWSSVQRRRPTMLDPRWYEEELLSWAMADESVKVQMFRFVDVLPMLRSPQSINQHLHEYFEDVKARLPWAARLGMNLTESEGVLSRLLSYTARKQSRQMARKFIAGETLQEIQKSVIRSRDSGFACTIDVLGEAVLSDTEAEQYQQQYIELMDHLAPLLKEQVPSTLIDEDDLHSLPRLNLSLKLSALDAHFRAVDSQGTTERIKNRLRPLLRKAIAQEVFLNIDMEQYAYRDLTMTIFSEVLMEDEFRNFADIGIVVQAYLKDWQQQLDQLLELAKARGTSITVRLVKGAYWDYETINAKQKNWPSPVFEEKWQSDAAYEQAARFLIDNADHLRPAFGSHNLRSLCTALGYAKQKGLPASAVEVQMLYGMAVEQAQAFHDQGYRVRIYMPYGELIPGMSYLVRRLLENTSNDSFLRLATETETSIEQLMQDPEAHAQQATTKSPTKTESKTSDSEQESKTELPIMNFENEPLSDFSKAEVRDAMQQALDSVREQLGKNYAIVIDNKSYDTRQQMQTVSPSKPSVTVGTFAKATAEHVDNAVTVARRAFGDWSAETVQHRVEYLGLLAEQIKERRFEFCAWMSYECGKTWEEADAEVCEAIDFCRYYGELMTHIDKGHRFDVPGEWNDYTYRPRGVAAVIAPWNFPLAILTGMTAAALVTGNTVIMKPAEQSSVVAAKLMECFQACHFPQGVVNYVPGTGEEAGNELVTHLDVDLICFTGSQEVGLEINRLAADTDSRQTGVKKVIAEMGGKNAIIVDEDADLDEAITGVLYSAFGYAGQKCSACSRVILVGDVETEFLKRFEEAVLSLPIGAAEDPGTLLGPVIDSTTQERLQEAIEAATEEAELLVSGTIPKKSKGYFVAPHVFATSDLDSDLAQKEFFGPILTVLKAENFTEALRIANQTEYALTGGVYSRSPANLKKARTSFQVGNLYLNRPCTGAIVCRQPFGGFKLSGIGSKAGGPDYLHQFLIPVNVSENTMRHGFAPTAEEPTEA